MASLEGAMQYTALFTSLHMATATKTNVKKIIMVHFDACVTTYLRTYLYTHTLLLLTTYVHLCSWPTLVRSARPNFPLGSREVG